MNESTPQKLDKKVPVMTTDEEENETMDCSDSYTQVLMSRLCYIFITFFVCIVCHNWGLIIFVLYCQDYFCYICDQVPKRICYTCDDQLFCLACFKEYHEDEDEPHKWKPFNIRRVQPDSDSD